jgi:hypothetical protein
LKKKSNKIKNGSSRGGAREGAGRPKGALSRTTIAFRNHVREYTDEAVELHVEAMRDNELDMSLRLEAAQWLVDRGYGKASQQTTGPNDGPLQVEYHSFDEVRAVLLSKGIDYDRLPLPRMIKQIADNAAKNGNG